MNQLSLFAGSAFPKSAVFSPCRRYRYSLWRNWDFSEPYLMVIGLNPSTADETHDDPTVRRCVDFAKRWGYGALCMTNLFAFRATDPEAMKREADPIGAENDDYLRQMYETAGMALAAWGVHGAHQGRAAAVLKLLGPLMCLGANQDGSPKHPLYIAANTKPQRYPCLPEES